MRQEPENLIHDYYHRNYLEYPKNVLIEIMEIHRTLRKFYLLRELILQVYRLTVLKPAERFCDQVFYLELLIAVGTALYMRQELPEMFPYELVLYEGVHILFADVAVNVFHKSPAYNNMWFRHTPPNTKYCTFFFFFRQVENGSRQKSEAASLYETYYYLMNVLFCGILPDN